MRGKLVDETAARNAGKGLKMANLISIGYDEIARVNGEIELINIKGKQYAQVKDKIDAFRKLHPRGGIATELLQFGDVVVVKATVTDENGNVLGTGHAYEKENSTQINRTSYLENCETSAVGRALAMCGIGIMTSIASAEEVRNAQAQQEAIEKTPIDATKLRVLQYRCTQAGIDINELAADYNFTDPAEITEGVFMDIVNNWDKRVKGAKK